MTSLTPSSGSRLASWAMLLIVAVASVDGFHTSVLTWEVNGQTLFKFKEDKFIQLYIYLCDNTTDGIEIFKHSDWVSKYNRWTIDEDEIRLISHHSKYVCSRIRDYYFGISLFPYYYVQCEKLKPSVNVCQMTEGNCWSFSVSDTMVTNCDNIQIIWENQDTVVKFHDEMVVNFTQCVAECGITPISPSSAPTILTTSSLPSSTVSENASSPTQPSDLVGNQDEGDTTTIIIGVVVTLIVVAAILVVSGIVVWKRRRKASAGKSSTENHSGHVATNSTYSVAFQNINDTTTSGQREPNNVPEDLSYDYVNPAQKVRSNGAAIASNTEDRKYYNQDAFEGNTHFDNANGRSVLAGEREPGYYNLDNGQNDSIAAIMSDASSLPLSAISDSQDSENVYSGADGTAHTADGTYSMIDGHTSKSRGSTHPDRSDNYNTPANAEYAQANLALSALGSEYSKLHDPIRHIRDPYSVLPPSESEGNQAASITPTPSASTDSAPFTYSLAQPFLKEPTSHTQLVQVIDNQ